METKLCGALFVVILGLFCVSSTPVTHKAETSDGKSDSTTYHSEDPYLNECYEDCKVTGDLTTCLKYRTLRYLHEKTAAVQDDVKPVMTLGRFSLEALPQAKSMDSASYSLGLSKYSATDSEMVKMFRFALRELQRLSRSYTVTMNKKSLKSGSDDGSRLIGETLFSGAMGAKERSHKKSKLALLLPFIYFLHLKALLVPIFLAVLFIKKVIVAGAIILAIIKLCKHHHYHHSWEPDHAVEYHSDIASAYHVPNFLDLTHGHGAEAIHDDSWGGKYSETDGQNFEHNPDHVTDIDQWNYSKYSSQAKSRPFSSVLSPASIFRKKPWLAPYTPNGCSNPWSSVDIIKYTDNQDAEGGHEVHGFSKRKLHREKLF